MVAPEQYCCSVSQDFVLEQYIMNAHLDIYSTKQLRLMIEASLMDEKPVTIGTIDLFDFDPVNLRAGVGILDGQGLAKQGLCLGGLKPAIIDYGFNTLNLHQLFCGICTDNESSLNLFQKHGFRITGTREQWVRNRQQWVDEYFLQLFNTKA
jgi:diamine N-acetyltransferase